MIANRVVEPGEDLLHRREQHVRDGDVRAGSSSDSPSSTVASSTTPLTAAFAIVVSTATGSLSTARIGSNPRRAAAIDSTPDPQPTSSSDPRSDVASSSTQRRVVGCAPVPKARPGSITTAGSPGSGCSHGGPIQSPPARAGRWNARQASSQPGSTGVTSTSANAARIGLDCALVDVEPERRASRPSPTPRSRRAPARARPRALPRLRERDAGATRGRTRPSSELEAVGLRATCRRRAPRRGRRASTVKPNGSPASSSRSACSASRSSVLVRRRPRRSSDAAPALRTRRRTAGTAGSGHTFRPAARRTAREARARARRARRTGQPASARR